MKKAYIFAILAFFASASYGGVIYDDQTYDYNATLNAGSIWGEDDHEIADDFETTADWTLELVRFWFLYSGEQDIRVDIFSNGPDNKPASPPPGDLYNEEVSSTDIAWTDTGDEFPGWPIYRVDIPVSGFDIIAGTRYWLGLQSITGNKSWWLVFQHDYEHWWEIAMYHDGSEWRIASGPFEEYACEFELHGTPVSSVKSASLGTIKALFR